jgi:hypothetical protein
VRFEPVRHAEPQPHIEEPHRVQSEPAVAATATASTPAAPVPAPAQTQASAPAARDSAPRESRERRDAGPAPREGAQIGRASCRERV